MSQKGLVLHTGARLIGRQDLQTLATPEPTDTHVPVPHATLIETILESLAYRQLEVMRDEYAVTGDGMRLFGFLELNIERDGIRLALVLRNSHDKSVSLGMLRGYRTFCCDNLAFHGEFTAIARKHTKHVDLTEVVGIGVDRVQRHFVKIQETLDAWRGYELPDAHAKAIIYDAFIERKLRVPKKLASAVHRNYFDPRHEEFRPRTFYSLSQAFTSSFKELDVVRKMEATAALSPFLARYQS
jgi:hypothetical protein